MADDRMKIEQYTEQVAEYYKQYIEDQMKGKQNQLVEGTNITLEPLPNGITRISSRGGGGTGGTSDYNDLENKPKIEGVTVQGSQTAEDLRLASKTYVDTNIGNIEVLLSTI